MIRMDPGIVLKYFAPIDAFIKIRRFSADEVSRLLATARLTDRRSYVGLVVNACIPTPTAPMLEHEEKLYELCIDANPLMDISKVSISASEEPGPLHLLEQAPAPRDYRRLQDIEEELSRRVIGQQAAVASVSRAIRKAMTGLRDKRRPIATFLFVGQTGVGKTELAKSLTVYLFHDPSRMVRVDCSEYALPHEYAKLLGAPPGYVGYDQGGLLSGLAQAQGPSTVLFDEIEKSDQKVHDLLLQVMDEGSLKDSQGRVISFGETVVILTSNLGSSEAEALRRRIGFGGSSVETSQLLDEFSRAIKTTFRPEFVNRLTEVVFFNPIGLDECEKIALLFLEEARKHAANVPITLRFSSGVPRFLAEKSYNPEYGARELRRTIESEVEGRLSEMLVDGTLREGGTVLVKVVRDRLSFLCN